jgi:hypothetical protein
MTLNSGGWMQHIQSVDSPLSESSITSKKTKNPQISALSFLTWLLLSSMDCILATLLLKQAGGQVLAVNQNTKPWHEHVLITHHSTWMNQNGVTVNCVPQLQFTLVFIHSAQALIFDCGYPKLVAGMLVIHSVIFFVLFFDFYQRTYLRDCKAQKKLQ